MGKLIRLLIVEDVEDHALLLVRELHKGGLSCEFERVETVEELKSALDAAPWDAVISDYNLPGFDGLDALRIVREKGVDLPFLLVSGAIGEEKAAEVMKAGAQDYIRKGNYARLVPTLERELRDARVRQERRHTAEELTRYREHLEDLVQERTAELLRVNEELQAEKVERERLLLQLEAVLENITEGVIISDLQGNVLNMNKEAMELCRFHDMTEARLHLARYLEIFEIYDLQGRPVPPDQWPLARAINGERFVDQELDVRRKDLGKLWIGSYSGTPVCNSSGENCLAVVTVKDVTLRKEAEEQLLKSESKFVKIFHSSPSMVTLTTLPEGRVVDVNDTVLQTLDYQRGELIGRTTEELGIWPDPAERETVIRKVQEEGQLRNTEVTLRARDGRSLVGLFYAERISFGEDTYMLSFVRDITERKQSEEEIARLNADLAARVAELEERTQELEAFNRMVSHDLRQPINLIALACQEMELLRGELPTDRSGTIATIHSGVLRMNAIIETLLKFSRSTHGDLRRESFDLSAMVRSVAEEVCLAQPGRKLRFEIPEGIVADGDPGFVRSVLENLIGNACKYTGRMEEARIEFGVASIDGRRTYFVRDNGEGFDMADAGKLFVPFQRLHEGEEFQGSGIGLATAERIIRRHGGRIWAEGERGKGATFYFTLNGSGSDGP